MSNGSLYNDVAYRIEYPSWEITQNESKLMLAITTNTKLSIVLINTSICSLLPGLLSQENVDLFLNPRFVMWQIFAACLLKSV